MLQAVSQTKSKISFSEKRSEQTAQPEGSSHILPNTPKTRIRQNSQKLENALVYYPVRGLKGDVNSNFYEFLTMGIVPYLAGSAAFMFVFNAANKYLNLFEKEKASTYGKKMALGVVMFGLMKSLSKPFVTKPVKYATGVDTELPYENIVYSLPTGPDKDATIDVQYQQRKVYDSKEFFRKDLLDKSYFDKVAAKLGLGKNLNDAESEVTPIIQNIVATTSTAKSLSSYAWAAVGVMMAVQDCWKDFFSAVSNRTKFAKDSNNSAMQNLFGRLKNFGKNSFNISKSFIKSFCKSFGQLWQGNEGYSGFKRHAGKFFITLAALATTVLTSNAITRARKMAGDHNAKTIDKSKESTVI